MTDSPVPIHVSLCRLAWVTGTCRPQKVLAGMTAAGGGWQMKGTFAVATSSLSKVICNPAQLPINRAGQCLMAHPTEIPRL